MDIPFSLTLSFDDLEVLLLVENGGASPLEVEESLGIERHETKTVFRDLVRRGLLDWQGRSHAQGALPWPWSFGSTVFQLTPLARSLRGDDEFVDTAFAASILLTAPTDKVREQRAAQVVFGHGCCRLWRCMDPDNGGLLPAADGA